MFFFVYVATAFVTLKTAFSKFTDGDNHVFYIITYIGLKIFKHKTMMNLRDRDNLRTKDNRPVPKVSFVRRFDCN